MKWVHPALQEPICLDGKKIPSLVIENKAFFRSLVCECYDAVEGCKTDIVLSEGEKLLDVPKSMEIIGDFVRFDINKKSLLSKVLAEMERAAVSPEHYVKTGELLAMLQGALEDWSFSLPCEVFFSKLSVSTLLKAAGVELKSDYEGAWGEAEKIVDYMELVRELDREKLFVTVNMRAFFEDAVIDAFQRTLLSHELQVLMVEPYAAPLLPCEKRITVDQDLCEF